MGEETERPLGPVLSSRGSVPRREPRLNEKQNGRVRITEAVVKL